MIDPSDVDARGVTRQSDSSKPIARATRTVTAVDETISQIKSLRQLLRADEERRHEVNQFLLRNLSVIRDYLTFVYEEHSEKDREELFALRASDDFRRLEYSAISDGFYSICTYCVSEDLPKLVITGYSDVEDDDLNMLLRGLEFARCLLIAKNLPSASDTPKHPHEMRPQPQPGPDPV